MREPPIAPILLLLLCLACGGDSSGTRDHEGWLTELEHRFTGTAEQGVLFNWAFLRADPYRDRIFIVDPMETQVSAWQPDGSLVIVVGRKGEGPGEFTQPSRIYFAEDGGFTVREGWGTRFTHYTADGELVGTEFGLTTSLSYENVRVGLEAPTGDGGYLAAVQRVQTSGVPWRAAHRAGAPLACPALRERTVAGSAADLLEEHSQRPARCSPAGLA